MTRAVQLNQSARAERLLPGIIDRALHHGDRVPLLTVALATTTTQTPRLTQQYQMDDDDIASLASRLVESLQP